MPWRGQMLVSRHACWRGRGLTWRRPGALTADRAGPAAPPILARQCRVRGHGASGPNKTPRPSPRPHAPLPARPRRQPADAPRRRPSPASSARACPRPRRARPRPRSTRAGRATNAGASRPPAARSYQGRLSRFHVIMIVILVRVSDLG